MLVRVGVNNFISSHGHAFAERKKKTSVQRRNEQKENCDATVGSKKLENKRI